VSGSESASKNAIEMTMRERLSVHNVTFLGANPAELHRHWTALGLRHLSILDAQLLEPGFVRLVQAEDYAIEAVYHLFGGAADLSRLIDAAAATGARCIYMLTGGRDGLSWEGAAERFCRAVEPCVQEAARAGVGLAIENASSLYADIHLAHSLRDTITLAELAGVGICIDLFHCWAEADLAGLLRMALPRTQLIQLSDYVPGDRALPARAVPGDGAIPIESFVAQALAGGYRFGFDLELLGPRIDAEGRLAAAGRACATVGAMLDRLERPEG
jgi:sugar phosphate isomerase/epimerase